MRPRASGIARVSACFTALALTNASRAAAAYCLTTGRAPPSFTECPAGVPLRHESRCASYSEGTDALPMALTRDVFVALLESAARPWGEIACGVGRASLTFSHFARCRPGLGFRREGSNANVIAFRTVWGDDAVHRPGAAAVTVLTFDPATHAILDFDTELNLRTADNRDGFIFVEQPMHPGEAHLASVLLHEFGHAAGLDHSFEPTAVMMPSSGVTRVATTLTDDDMRGACAAHDPRRDAGCDATPRGGFACGGGCGCRISAPAMNYARTSMTAVLVGLATVLARTVSRRRSGG